MKKETLTEVEKALAYAGASVVSGCMPCTRFHIKKCKSLGIPDKDIEDAIIYSTEISASALDNMKKYGLRQLQSDLPPPGKAGIQKVEHDKMKVIVSLTAAYVSGNTHEFRNYLKSGREFDLTIDDLLTITDIAWIIKDKGQEQLDKLFDKGDHETAISCCG